MTIHFVIYSDNPYSNKICFIKLLIIIQLFKWFIRIFVNMFHREPTTFRFKWLCYFYLGAKPSPTYSSFSWVTDSFNKPSTYNIKWTRSDEYHRVPWHDLPLPSPYQECGGVVDTSLATALAVDSDVCCQYLDDHKMPYRINNQMFLLCINAGRARGRYIIHYTMPQESSKINFISCKFPI